jgi:hypothetical protein
MRYGATLALLAWSIGVVGAGARIDSRADD